MKYEKKSKFYYINFYLNNVSYSCVPEKDNTNKTIAYVCGNNSQNKTVENFGLYGSPPRPPPPPAPACASGWVRNAGGMCQRAMVQGDVYCRSIGAPGTNTWNNGQTCFYNPSNPGPGYTYTAPVVVSTTPGVNCTARTDGCAPGWEKFPGGSPCRRLPINNDWYGNNLPACQRPPSGKSIYNNGQYLLYLP